MENPQSDNPSMTRSTSPAICCRKGHYWSPSRSLDGNAGVGSRSPCRCRKARRAVDNVENADPQPVETFDACWHGSQRAAHPTGFQQRCQLPHLDPPCSPTNSRTADQLYKSTPGGFEHIACRFRSARCHRQPLPQAPEQSHSPSLVNLGAWAASGCVTVRCAAPSSGARQSDVKRRAAVPVRRQRA